MYPISLLNEDAKKFVIENEIFSKEDVNITEWLDEKNIKIYLCYEKDIIKSFVLLTKMDKDPLKKYNNPYHLNYVYTFEDFRKKGFAFYLISEIKKSEEVTVFCSDDITQNLFKKAGYIFNSLDPLYKSLPIYRYP